MGYNYNNNYYNRNTNWHENRRIKAQAESPPGRSRQAPPPDEYVLEMIKESIADEYEDAEYYERLMSMAIDRGEKDILRQIQLDELKHAKIFTDIYSKLTGVVPTVKKHEPSIGKNLLAEYERSIFSELHAVEIYRKLLFAFSDLITRDMINDVIFDEQAHALKANYLYAKNKSL